MLFIFYIFSVVAISMEMIVKILGAFDLKENYIGCFKDVRSIKEKRVKSVEECENLCKAEENISLIALKNGKECNCINRLDAALPSSDCMLPCTSDEACGGKETYSVYRIDQYTTHDDVWGDISEYENYFILISNISLNISYNLQRCAHFCLEVNATFFMGLEQSLCKCLYNYPDVVAPNKSELQCNEMCSDLPGSICNCHYIDSQNTNLVYALRFQYEFQRGRSTYAHCTDVFTDICHVPPCKHIEFTEISDCRKGCKDGWKGESCKERDCTSNNGDCGIEMKCVEILVNKNLYVECACPFGTVRNKWQQCEVFRNNLANRLDSFLSSTYNMPGRGLMSADRLADGAYDGYMMAHTNDPKTAWMAVDLSMLYCVGFVRAYNRIMESEEMYMLINEFAVKLSKNFDINTKAGMKSNDELFLCGYGPKKALQGGNPMIVFCQNFTVLSKFVIIHQPGEREGNLALAELEIYEVGCDILNGRCGEKKCNEDRVKNGPLVIRCTDWTDVATINTPWYGCYEQVEAEFYFLEYGMTYLECKIVCDSRDYLLSVMKAGLKCACGDKLLVKGKLSTRLCKKGHFRTNFVYAECEMKSEVCSSLLETTTLPNTLATPNAFANLSEQTTVGPVISTSMMYIIIGISSAPLLLAIIAGVLAKRRKKEPAKSAKPSSYAESSSVGSKVTDTE
ncbi:hypothetical protein HELRODRAFT_195136 [Helobdella robusta]|uniref:WSC domain-containing protein n=1 Tax=Helobdella robusta TaxID=6412 RepID=T1FWS7_HELRO|nr:hypothetical protein HELRODRAFT_195136 [Helobdella robusta]ESN95065.1 hypothetical protein HELRODRAFT_195136 [Helobdella robusta]